jgi:hypothetical protein
VLTKLCFCDVGWWKKKNPQLGNFHIITLMFTINGILDIRVLLGIKDNIIKCNDDDDQQIPLYINKQGIIDLLMEWNSLSGS